MDFGERLQRLRRQAGLSQEELGARVGVSRQAVSKWESGQARPDMDKLAALAEQLGVSMDTLARGEEGAQAAASGAAVTISLFGSYHYEYKSKRTLFGLPLFHVNIGSRRGRPYVARGVFAFGTVALGVVSFGVVSVGVLAFGVLALGALALGALGAGLGAFGGAAVGVIAAGGLAVGVVSFGGMALGQYAVGGLAVASHVAIGDYARAPVAVGHTAAIGVHTLLAEGPDISSVPAESACALILQSYPHIWNPLLRFLTIFLAR